MSIDTVLSNSKHQLRENFIPRIQLPLHHKCTIFRCSLWGFLIDVSYLPSPTITYYNNHVKCSWKAVWTLFNILIKSVIICRYRGSYSPIADHIRRLPSLLAIVSHHRPSCWTAIIQWTPVVWREFHGGLSSCGGHIRKIHYVWKDN